MNRPPLVATPDNGTILLCDDEPGVRRIVRALLTRHGYQVLEAANGKHALMVSAAFAGTIDLLLTDVLMPEVNGAELAEQLRVVRPAVRVIFMSGGCGDLLSSLDGCLLVQKPFEPASILKVVRESLSKPPNPLRLS